MIYIRTGSQALSILTLLAVTGEYPTASFRLLGNERSVKALVHKMTTVQTYRLPQTETEMYLPVGLHTGSPHPIKLHTCDSAAGRKADRKEILIQLGKAPKRVLRQYNFFISVRANPKNVRN